MGWIDVEHFFPQPVGTVAFKRSDLRKLGITYALDGIDVTNDAELYAQLTCVVRAVSRRKYADAIVVGLDWDRHWWHVLIRHDSFPRLVPEQDVEQHQIHLTNDDVRYIKECLTVVSEYRHTKGARYDQTSRGSQS